MMALFGGIWAKLALVGGLILAAALAVLRFFAQAKKAGVDQQRAADLQQAAKDRQTADAVRYEVARLPDAAVDQRVRKWERD